MAINAEDFFKRINMAANEAAKQYEKAIDDALNSNKYTRNGYGSIVITTINVPPEYREIIKATYRKANWVVKFDDSQLDQREGVGTQSITMSRLESELDETAELDRIIKNELLKEKIAKARF